MIRRATNLFALLVVLLVCALVLSGVLPVEPLLYRFAVVSDPPRRADAIVVLGGGIFDEGLPSHASTSRLVHGLRLQRRGYAPIVILTGGNPVDPTVPESMVMRRVAEELGTKPEILVVEATAARTATQSEAVARIARARGIHSILLVTSAEHSFRAVRSFRKTGLDVVSTPVVGQRPPRVSLELRPIRIVERVLALIPWGYEAVAIGLYWWRGWL
jgi:uncharacterized SAM-binding protein YcdF (DUF218 family)